MDTTITPAIRPAAYPVPDPGQDSRFTYGLLFDIAEVLRRHGYPQPAGTDWADLMLALSRFIYQNNKET
jgi:hypothetical protein